MHTQIYKFIYGNASIAAMARDALNKKSSMFENIRWELARRGGLTSRQLHAIFGGVSTKKINSYLVTMYRRGVISRSGGCRNYLWCVAI